MSSVSGQEPCRAARVKGAGAEVGSKLQEGSFWEDGIRSVRLSQRAPDGAYKNLRSAILDKAVF